MSDDRADRSDSLYMRAVAAQDAAERGGEPGPSHASDGWDNRLLDPQTTIAFRIRARWREIYQHPHRFFPPGFRPLFLRYRNPDSSDPNQE